MSKRVVRSRPARRRGPSLAAASLAILAALAGGCGAPDRALAPRAPDAASGARSRDAAATPAASLAAAPVLLACDEATPRVTSGLVGLLGGVLDAGAARVEFPLGAVLDLRRFTLAVQPGPHAVVDVHADGLAHFLFARPVTVTLDLARCADVGDGVSVWHVDAATGAFLEDMGGIVDPLRRTITFRTPHLSIYAVAN